MNQTLDYYNQNAAFFSAGTQNASMHDAQDHFLKQSVQRTAEFRAQQRFKRYCLNIQKVKKFENGRHYKIYRKGNVYHIGLYYPRYRQDDFSKSKIKKMDDFFSFTNGDPKQFASHCTLLRK